MFVTVREAKLSRIEPIPREKPSDDTSDGLQQGESGEEPDHPNRQGG